MRIFTNIVTVRPAVFLIVLSVPALFSAAGEPCLAAEGESEKVIVMPIDFEVGQLTAGGVTEMVADSSKSACNSLHAGVVRWFENRPEFEVVSLPELGEAHAGILDEHAALLDATINDVILLKVLGGKPWRHKLVDFDYSIGPGLTFLRDLTGADKIVFVDGYQLNTTGGRKALAVFSAVMGYTIQGGRARITVGIVDIETGAVEWPNYMIGFSGKDVTGLEGAHDVVSALMADYPRGRILLGGQS